MPAIDISQLPSFYEKRGEWALAAGAYLANGQSFEAGLSLLRINDHRQASLAFNLAENARQKIQELIQQFLGNKNDVQAAELCEDWGMVLLEQLGDLAHGNIDIARWFERAAENYMLANKTLEAKHCRELAAQVMEIPLIKLEVVAGEDTRWLVDEPVLLQVKISNIGHGPARRVTVKVGGNIKKPHPMQDFINLAVDNSQHWDNVRVIPNSAGAGLLEFFIDYESFRTRQTAQTKFTHRIQVEKNQEAAILRALEKNASLHIEKFFSPGTTHNEIEVSDAQGIIIGDAAQANLNVPGIQEGDRADVVTLVVSAMISGLTSGLIGTVKDVYGALRSLIIKSSENNEDAMDAIAKVEKQPSSKARQELLKEELSKLKLDQDDAVIKLARSLLDMLKPPGNAGSK